MLDSKVANHGMLGVNITNSSSVTVSDCVVEQTGSGGIWLDGGDRDALVSANLTLQVPYLWPGAPVFQVVSAIRYHTFGLAPLSFK